MKVMETKPNISVEVIENPGEFEYEEALETDTDKHNLVKAVESLVRGSLEYGDYISFLRENVGMDACAFFSNMSKATNKRIRIEVHHAPLTLYDITKLVLCRMIRMGEEVNDMTVSEEVTRLHYQNRVGLIPLSKTLHEVVHSGSDKLVIPMFLIYGNLRSFMAEYEEELEMEENAGIKKKIENMFQKTKELNEHSFDILKEKFTYIEVEDFQELMKMEEETKEEKKQEKKAKKAA